MCYHVTWDLAVISVPLPMPAPQLPTSPTMRLETEATRRRGEPYRVPRIILNAFRSESAP